MGAEHSHLGSSIPNEKSVTLSINDAICEVRPGQDEFDPDYKLVDYIRDRAGLTGTKVMCREGGCGACVVTVRSQNLQTGEMTYRSVNSCMVPIMACDGWEVLTVEKLGSVRDSMNVIQQRLVQFGGSQCGFCTPGMVMCAYSWMKSKDQFAVKDIEDCLDGNICRCTGYRQIIDAFQSLESDSPSTCEKEKEYSSCLPSEYTQGHIVSGQNGITIWEFQSGQEWVSVTDLRTLLAQMLRYREQGRNFKLMAGNTGVGVFRKEGPFRAFIDISGIADLSRVIINSETVVLGAGTTLTMAIDALSRASQFSGFTYTGNISEHLKRVATTAVRNIGTVGGNLMVKHKHPEFPSDVFLLMETVGVEVSIVSDNSPPKRYTPTEFLALDMSDKVILSVSLPKLTDSHFFRSFKIASRYQNSQAYINAGFLMKLTSDFTVAEKPTVVLGGISSQLVHVDNLEMFLNGKILNDDQVLQESMNILERNIIPDPDPLVDTVYKKLLTQSLLFKYIIGILGDRVRSPVASGGKNLTHIGRTSGNVIYDTDKTKWPLYQPVAKLEAAQQCTGEAKFISDIDPSRGELIGVFVTTKVANAAIKSVNASKALAIPDVVAFIEARDIPGKNNYMPFGIQPEPIFATDRSRYAGQPVGLLVAKNRITAVKAARRVKITYEDTSTPITSIEDAVGLRYHVDNNNDSKPSEAPLPRFSGLKSVLLSTQLTDVPPDTTVAGNFRSGSQYHFHLETQTCVCIPTEDGMHVYASTQWIDHVQQALSDALALPSNYFNMNVTRIGGGYGAKLTRCASVACATAVAAFVLKCPVRVVLDLETNMEMIGGRLPYLTIYEAGVTHEGILNGLKATMVCDSGWSSNEITSTLSIYSMQSCYRASGWKLKAGHATTHTAPKTYCRAPGTTEAIAAIETIMDHIAFKLGKDPLQVRLSNLLRQGDPILGTGENFKGNNLIPAMIETLKESADLENREFQIKGFNSENRWNKRGLAVVPMRYPVNTNSVSFKTEVVIYHADGSVAVSHSGIEMGQGINTKVAQVVAHELNIPLSMIRVKPTNNMTSGNCLMTGGAITSEYCCYAALKACGILNGRIDAVRKQLKDPSWEHLIQKCHKMSIDLKASYQIGPDDAIGSYDVWGVIATEVEIDCLTGEYKIARVDLIDDAGKSISPDVDVGQVTGSVIMGFGLWLTEKYKYDADTGRLLTNRTWKYKVPAARDIPEVFNVTLMKNATNPLGILSSKATGEPMVCISCSVLMALRAAIASARRDAGNADWFQLDGPVTPEDILKLCLTEAKMFTL